MGHLLPLGIVIEAAGQVEIFCKHEEKIKFFRRKNYLLKFFNDFYLCNLQSHNNRLEILEGPYLVDAIRC